VLKRRSIRLPEHDYSTAGAYYITICTFEKKYLFGEVNNNKSVLNEYGKIAKKIWKQTPDHFEHLQLDEFIVMPNHIHGIIVFLKPQRAWHAKPLQNFGQPVSHSLSTVIGSFKSAVTKKINELNCGERIKLWQRNYWERIIRNEVELNRVREYIVSNPSKWGADELNHLFRK